VLKIESNRRRTIAALATRHEAYLQAREDEKHRRKREALRRIAPGFEPRSAPLVPVKTGAALVGHQEGGSDSTAAGLDLPPRDVMDDLVDSLAAMEDSH
jgi:hypothetical protein